MAPSRKVKRSTRRGKATRRRQRGGDNAMVASVSANAKPANAKPANAKPANSKPANAAGKTYTLTLTLPLSTTSTCADFPSDLGKFSGAVQGFSFTNPTKTITDIQFVDNAGKVVKDAAKYGTSSSSSAIKIMIGSAQNLLRGRRCYWHVRGRSVLRKRCNTSGRFKWQDGRSYSEQSDSEYPECGGEECDRKARVADIHGQGHYIQLNVESLTTTLGAPHPV